MVNGLTAGEVVKLAGVTDRKGLRGLSQFVSRRLYRYHARKGAAVKLADFGLSTAYVFDPATARTQSRPQSR